MSHTEIETTLIYYFLAQSDGDGVALINFMHRMNNEEYDDENRDLEPSAEDLEIFAELDREQVERQARIDRGEPAVDPMVSVALSRIQYHTLAIFMYIIFIYLA